MSNLTLLVAAITLAACVNALGQSSASETELPRLVALCNEAADSGRGERRAMRACEALVKEGRLGLAEPAAATAYQRYQDDLERWRACQARQLPVRDREQASWACSGYVDAEAFGETHSTDRTHGAAGKAADG